MCDAKGWHPATPSGTYLRDPRKLYLDNDLASLLGVRRMDLSNRRGRRGHVVKGRKQVSPPRVAQLRGQLLVQLGGRHGRGTLADLGQGPVQGGRQQTRILNTQHLSQFQGGAPHTTERSRHLVRLRLVG